MFVSRTTRIDADQVVVVIDLLSNFVDQGTMAIETITDQADVSRMLFDVLICQVHGIVDCQFDDLDISLDLGHSGSTKTAD
jgi:hypothetical protein